MMQEKTWSERAGKTFCILCLILGVYLVLRYALGVVLPFIIAWALAMITSPAAKWLSKTTRLPRKFCAAFMTVLFIGGIAGALFLAFDRLVYESERLLIRLSEDSHLLGNAVASFLDKLSSFGDKKIPVIDSLLEIEAFRRFWENIDSVISNAVSEAVSAVTKQIPTVAFGIIKEAPGVLIFILITLISCFYFSADIEQINAKLISILPQNWQKKIPAIKRGLIVKAGRYARAYLLLLLLTFGELLVGFFILGVSYPLLLALLVAVLDILPVLGVGTVLIPWALAEILLFRDNFTGIGLFILYVIITIIRQITEPKIVAGSLGLHPLLTLISMYIGLKIFGVLGMIGGPLILMLLRSVRSNIAVDKVSVL